jgi:hypothetical protein
VGSVTLPVNAAVLPDCAGSMGIDSASAKMTDITSNTLLELTYTSIEQHAERPDSATSWEMAFSARCLVVDIPKTLCQV